MYLNKKLLYQYVSWCVWHDGLRLYDSDVPGYMNDVNVLRAGFLRLQQHNGEAEKLISDASDNEMADVLNLIEPGVEKEYNLTGHFSGWRNMKPDGLHCRICWQLENMLKYDRFITISRTITATPGIFFPM